MFVHCIKNDKVKLFIESRGPSCWSLLHSLKGLGVLPLPSGGGGGLLRASLTIHCNPFILLGGEGSVRVKNFAKDLNTMTWPGPELRPLDLQSNKLTIGYCVSHD